MDIPQIEQLITELLDQPVSPLTGEQKRFAYEFALGLFEGRLPGVASVPVTLQQLQGMHALSQKQTFFIDYFLRSQDGRRDIVQLGLLPDASPDKIRATLLDVPRIQQQISSEERKQMAERSGEWRRELLVQQLGKEASSDADFPQMLRVTANYEPDRLLEKADGVRQYRQFFRDAEQLIASEPDQLLADAQRALLKVYVARLNAMAAVDVYPGLLSLEEQLTHSSDSPQVRAWTAKLREAAPIVAAIHLLPGPDRLRVREVYVQHLDAIRQGAPFELDDIDDQRATGFSDTALNNLVAAIAALEQRDSAAKTELAEELEGVMWDAGQTKQFIESVLAEWGVLSDHQSDWQEVDDREGFAPDEKYQVVVTPRRSNMSVDSTRRIVNIPENLARPLAGIYPAGILPLVAHELTHVLQSYADYELGQQIPLAKIKGRRYRILREAGGVYQERVLHSQYFGYERSVNLHYLRAYQAKVAGASQMEVIRVFYNSLVGDQALDKVEDSVVRAFAVDRASRLYRRGGHNSQVLDYIEQMVVSEALLEQMSPEQVDAFLLGSTSFSLSDSADLHRYGLLMLPDQAALSPAHTVMKVFQEQFYPVV